MLPTTSSTTTHVLLGGTRVNIDNSVVALSTSRSALSKRLCSTRPRLQTTPDVTIDESLPRASHKGALSNVGWDRLSDAPLPFAKYTPNGKFSLPPRQTLQLPLPSSPTNNSSADDAAFMISRRASPAVSIPNGLRYRMHTNNTRRKCSCHSLHRPRLAWLLKLNPGQAVHTMPLRQSKHHKQAVS